MSDIKDQLQKDLKVAMLARDGFATEVIKSLKSAILYAEVAAGKREQGLTDEEILAVFKKESKKRQESSSMYMQGGNREKAEQELQEKAVIDAYLPQQMTKEQTNQLIDTVLTDMGITLPTKQDMGRVIGAARKAGGATVDGVMLAQLVNERIAQWLYSWVLLVPVRVCRVVAWRTN